MSETLDPGNVASALPSASAPRGLSDAARLIDTVTAPSRTFTDIRRSSRWWLPYVIGVLITYAFAFAVDRQIGWTQIAENQIKQSPKMQEQFANLEATQVTEKKQQIGNFTRYSFYSAPVLSLIFAAVCASVLLATINFGFGGDATFGKMFAVWIYATLPLSLKYLLATAVLFAGMSPEQFQLQNPVGTNLAYYLPADTPKGILTMATSVDIMTIWTVILLTIGCAIIGNIKRSSAAIAVVGWWVLIILASTALAIVQS